MSSNLSVDQHDFVATRASRVPSRDSRFFKATRNHRPTGAPEIEVHELAGVIATANSPGLISCAHFSSFFLG